MPKRLPNIIFTIADDQRASALGCAGVENVATPHLDRLAERGTRFSHAFHFGSCHGGICAPSRAMLHTGQPYFKLDRQIMGPTYPRGSSKLQFPQTLGQKLQDAGYHTFATGKWHNGVDTFHASFNDGAKIMFGGMSDHWFVPVFDFDPTGKYPEDKKYLADGFSSEIFADEAISYIRSRRDSEQPFFCYCAFTAPHDPRTPPDRWRQRYCPEAMDLSPNVRMTPENDPGTLNIRDERLHGTPRNDGDLRRSLAEYYGMISHMDEQIGRIYDALEEIGAAEDTIVIHTADHGLAVGQHGLLGKQNMYEHSVRVPLIMAGPGIESNAVRDQLCYQHDLHPTLLELIGGQGEENCFASLVPDLTGEHSPVRSQIGCAFANLQRMVRDERFKLIEYEIDGKRRTELFDLQADPWEVNNLVDHPAQSSRIHAMRLQLKEWQLMAGDEHVFSS
ncbi:MAG: sulfatase-like hydrolase/transferase [Puniceicoccales bacterium]